MIENPLVIGLERDEPKQVAECAWCGGEIYEGDEVCEDEGGDVVHVGNCEQLYARVYLYAQVKYID